MPLIKRHITPIELSKVDKIDAHINNELEFITNYSLANVIRQLSSLSRNAEDMFSELSGEALKVFDRARLLHERVSRLQHSVTQLDATVEEVSLQDLALQKPYQSSFATDQQVVARNTIPQSIVATYITCEPPPHLSKLDDYREDGMECLKFYTDPGYFFELWYKNIKKDIEARKQELRERQIKKHGQRAAGTPKQIRPIHNRKDDLQDMAMGVEFQAAPKKNIPTQPSVVDARSRVSHTPSMNKMMNGPTPTPVMNAHSPARDRRSNHNVVAPSQGSRRVTDGNLPHRPLRPEQAPPAPPTSIHSQIIMSDQLPPPPLFDQGAELPSHFPPQAIHTHGSVSIDDLPPPPPSPPLPTHSFTENDVSRSPEILVPPPPPPPPPPPAIDANRVFAPQDHAPPPPPMSMMNGGPGNVFSDFILKPVSAETPVVEKKDGRSRLMENIRAGNFSLRSVADIQKERKPEKKMQSGGILDVQTIMECAFEMKRKAMEDSEDETEPESDDGDWEI